MGEPPGGHDLPRIRRSPIPADAKVVLRGDDLLPETSRQLAMRFRRRYPASGRWGPSGYYARNGADVDALAATRLERFATLEIYRIDTLRQQGFEVVPTFRSPHVTIAFDGDLDDGIARLRSTLHLAQSNPYNERR